jgi:hypothetical protein
LESNTLRNRVMAVPIVAAGQRFEAKVPTPLFTFSATTAIPQGNVFLYSHSGDGMRFLVNVQTAGNQPALTLVTNWQQLLTMTQTR